MICTVHLHLLGGRDYPRLFEELRNVGAEEIIPNCWGIVTSYSPDQLRTLFTKHMGKDDRIFIATTIRPAVGRNLLVRPEWLQEYL